MRGFGLTWLFRCDFKHDPLQAAGLQDLGVEGLVGIAGCFEVL